MKDDTTMAARLPAYAIGALDGDDAVELEAALARSPELREELAAWRRDIDGLCLAVEPVAPSETTRARVLRRIAEPAPVVAPEVRPSAPPTVAGAGRWGWAAAAAAVVLLAWGAWDRAAMNRELAALRASSAALESRLVAVSRDLEAAQSEVTRLSTASRIVAAPDMHPVVLAGLESARSASGRTFVSPRDGKALFYAYNLPAPPDGKQYQLWFIADGKPVSGGLLNIDRDGNAALVVEHVAPVASIQAWAVTVEPEGGRPAPSGAMVLKG